MKLLLDTHCLVWVLTDAPQLDAASRTVIANAEGVWFSEASIWELGLKWRKSKIAIQPGGLRTKHSPTVCVRSRFKWSHYWSRANCVTSMVAHLIGFFMRKRGTADSGS